MSPPRIAPVLPWIVRLLALAVGAALLAAWPSSAVARAATARIDRVVTPMATLQGVRVRLEWPEGAGQGRLRLQARHLEAPDLGYRFSDLDWQCLLQRAGDGWRCEGPVRGGGAGMRLAVALGPERTRAALTQGGSSVTVVRDGRTPELTRIDLASVPLAWTQALLDRAWPEARLQGGRADARLEVRARAGQRIRVSGPLRLHDASLDTPDGRIAAEGLDAQLQLDTQLGSTDDLELDGRLLAGELLYGTTYVAIAGPVALALRARNVEGAGWAIPRIEWHEPGRLRVAGSLAFTPDLALEQADLAIASPDLAATAEGYLSGWLGRAGLGELQLAGGVEADLRVQKGHLQQARLSLEEVSVDDPRGRFAFERLHGDVRFSAGATVSSELSWSGGSLYGLAFGASRLPFTSRDGVLQLDHGIKAATLGGTARIEQLRLRPPGPAGGLEITFGLGLDSLDVGQLAQALGWPAFTGRLSGRIPQARYANDRLEFDGGLSMALFDGTVDVSALAMERPFGVAPTLSADIAIDDLDLQSLTGVFGFGEITGALDGRIDGLRLVDWQPVAFDAALRTQRKPGLRQRISQRAVQDLSSVGDPGFAGTLQAQLIGLFDDFGYSRIGISCRLADEVCQMDGLGSAGRGFIIVQGSGLPRLTVVGFNRRVDWPTLVERLAAVGSGEIKPVVE
ncbi:hypothetical protein [Lysobacter sp. A3-1-A15]|uniref:hypothetical protein n=1 Tax=Novilysobacter viscosus TaxID=3098602 RepID=UPI002ED9274D